VGDIFGAPLAAEGVFAFFLESGFLGLYLFGRGRVPKGVHWFSILMVAVGATISAFWIIVANSWQQTPAGFAVNPATGRAELTSFAAAVFNPSSLIRFFHTLTAALVTGAFFMAGIAAWLVVRGRGRQVAGRVMKLALLVGFVASLLELFPLGHHHARQVARTQPVKLAAIEGLYETTQRAPLLLFGVPSTEPPYVSARIGVDGLLSWLATGDSSAEVRGLRDFPPDQVPTGVEIVLSFLSFHLMVGLGTLFIGLTGLALLLHLRGLLLTSRWMLKLLTLSIPLPLLACELGWITAEVGRQPWIVQGLLKTRDAASVTVSAGEILFSILLFGAIYLLLGALYVFLLVKKVKAGPEESAHAAPPAGEVA
jgi:cytochrome d ubiquinol oxidase subunit I